jgi:protein-S-isoprenylcysteine O-methyltransferase Ste14
MHPLCLTLIRRPDLVVDHLSAYAALLQQEASQASQTLITRVLIWFIAGVSVVICVVLSGTALMLGVLQNQFHWILVAVPGAMALCALGAFAWTRQPVLAGHFSNVKSQLLSDASALRAAAGDKAQ